jgi:hypothetical protein
MQALPPCEDPAGNIKECLEKICELFSISTTVALWYSAIGIQSYIQLNVHTSGAVRPKPKMY